MTAPLLSDEEFREEAATLSETDRDELRHSCRENNYFLARLLGYKDVNKQTHGAACKWIADEEKLRRLGLMPRGHLKSTVWTITDSLRRGLKDPDEYRGLIVNEVAENSEGFLKELKGHVINNELLRGLFAEAIPAKTIGPGSNWGVTSASLRRKRDYKESTWTAIGLGGAVTSRHYTHITCDDLIGLEANRSPAVMQAAKNWVANIEPLTVDAKTSIIDFIGTRWSLYDLYAYIMEIYNEDLSVFTRAAIEGGEVIFPQKYTMRFYQRLMDHQPDVWHAQYNNNPVASGIRDFNAGSLRSFMFDGEDVVFSDEGIKKRWPISILDKVILVDVSMGGSASSDLSSIVTVGTSPDAEVFALSCRSGRWNPSLLVDEIFLDAKRWRPRVVGIEKAGQQSTEHYFKRKCREELFFINVVPLKHANREKTERIRAGLDGIISSRRLFLLPSQQSLRQAIAQFPDLMIFDELDALAYYPQLAKTPLNEAQQKRSKAAHRLVLARRNPLTGY